ncbi:peptidoglycan DD-metalloendopeptidase family protein [Leucobacter sp. CSA1]|uniref:Peptidoglycan DD-metalloendopeptidase family protein n=1 Tax=Leucobacter chromiisoli TaxID=2796471 RepID=A0A934UWD4_9MICO|nr:peptidoglycan DD-metalloendopeptidase family protein [Leucobacter chromiisoli]MBK0420153.1 peptidoglycan DD-metalloendopeptidase family protein [Leucobacter chromiisoli]
MAITVKAPGIAKDIQKQLGGVDASGTGSRLGSKLADGMKKSLKVGAVGVASVLGTALVKGFGRLKAIETAEAKMRGIGFTSKEVAGAMDNALASVKGTAFGLGDAATTASQLMAANIAPGEKLEKVLKTVANNAALAGTGFGEMGSIFAKAATQANGVQNDVISQLADKGIPIYKALGEQMGVTAGEVFKLASEGKVDFETFAAAAEAAAGTAAAEMGGTTTGAFDNMMAALGRLGAKILEDIFPLIGPLFQNVTSWLDEATTHVEPLVDWLGNRLPAAIQSVRDFFSGLFSWVNANKDWLVPVAVGVGTVVAAVKTAQVATGIWKGTTAAFKAVQAAYVAYTYGMAGATYTYEGASKAGAIATKVFNAALRANPIGIIVTAVLALVAGLVYFFTQTETGKKVWAEFTRFLGEAWANISAFFQSVWENVLKPVFEAIGQVFSFVWNSILKPIFDNIVSVVTWVFQNILTPMFQAAQVGFAIMAGILQGVWDFILKPIFEALAAIVSWVWNSIVSPVVDWISEKWQILGIATRLMYEQYVKPVFDAIGVILRWVWNSIISPVVDWIRQKWTLLSIATRLMWEQYIKPAFDAIGNALRWVWTTIISPVVDWIRERWNLLGLATRLMYEQYIKPAWDAVAGVIRTVWDKVKSVIDTMVRVVKSDPKKAFEAARDAIGTAWKGIQDLAKKPVKFVVNTVINGLIDTINKIPGVNLSKVSLPKGFSDGGYTGALPATAVAGVVHGDEHVIRAASRRSIESRHPGLLDHMNRYGTVPGYKKGGWVTPLPKGSYSVSQPFHSGHNGIDLAAPTGTPIMAAADGTVTHAGWHTGGGGNQVNMLHPGGIVTWYAHMSRVLARVGQQVSQGTQIGKVGSTGNSTGPHLHYMIMPGGWPHYINPAPYMTGHTSPKGALDDEIGGLVGWAMNKFKESFPGSDMWVDAAGGLLKQGVESAVQWAMSKVGLDDGVGTATLYDSGGWLPTGLSLVENRTRRPEPILTGSQWDDIRRDADQGARSGPLVAHLYDKDDVLIGTIDGRIEDALEPMDATGLRRDLGVRG